MTRKTLTGLMFGLGVAAASFAPVAYSFTFHPNAGPLSGSTTVDFGILGPHNTLPVQNPMLSFSVGAATYQGGELFNMTTTGISGTSARPVGSTGNFWSIQAGQTGTVTFSGAGASYYGFLWGSPDPLGWNTVTFKDADGSDLGTYSGDSIPMTNEWTNSAYVYVTTDSGALIKSVVFTANQNAFEMDNHTFITAVPEPETYAMLLAGLGLLGFAARRRKQKEDAVA